MGRFNSDGLIAGESAAAVRVVVRGPSIRRAAWFVEIVGELIACGAIALGLVTVLFADVEQPFFVGIGVALAGVFYGLPLWLLGRVVSVAVDYLVAQTEELIGADED